MQPTHATSDMPWAEARVGKERLAFAYAWRAMLEAKIPLAFGSDFPVEHPNPLWGLYAARTRQDHSGQPPAGWTAPQRLSGTEALAAFTSGVAFAAHAETRRGRLAEGFDADFVVLPVDPVDGEAKALLDAKVLMTVVRGVDVYRAP
jgi:predicted amidohydrolase YtcJ